MAMLRFLLCSYFSTWFLKKNLRLCTLKMFQLSLATTETLTVWMNLMGSNVIGYQTDWPCRRTLTLYLMILRYGSKKFLWGNKNDAQHVLTTYPSFTWFRATPTPILSRPYFPRLSIALLLLGPPLSWSFLTPDIFGCAQLSAEWLICQVLPGMWIYFSKRLRQRKFWLMMARLESFCETNCKIYNFVKCNLGRNSYC